VGRFAGDDGNHGNALGAREAVERRRVGHGVLQSERPARRAGLADCRVAGRCKGLLPACHR
jgi:hypothetical protein